MNVVILIHGAGLESPIVALPRYSCNGGCNNEYVSAILSGMENAGAQLQALRRRIKKPCDHCGVEFIGLAKQSKYCSAACKQAAHRARNPGASREYSRQYYAKNAHKAKAQNLTREAIKAGVLVRPNKCEECGAEKRLDAHHDDYEKPLDVIFLCASCHKKRHQK